ncbi:MAG: GerMN domain-containing protein [Acidimicrobiales bacterium]
MRALPKLALLVAAAVFAPLVGVTPSVAELPVTITTTSPGEAALTDVTVSNVGSADRVVFTFAGGLPTVDAASIQPPFHDTAGNLVTVPGTSWVNLRLMGARGVSLGENCQSALPPPPDPGPGETAASVYFSCFDGLNGPAPAVPSGRVVPSGTPSEVLASTFGELLAGPSTSDATAGLTSWFSSATSTLLLSASIAPDGTATIDFDPALATTIPNASTSAGSDELVRQLDATVFQFTGVTSAVYELGGSCQAFSTWLQQSGCTPRTPLEGSQAQIATTYFGSRVVTGPSANVTEAAELEDFENQITWIIGLNAAADVTVTTATAPFRVIVTVPHVAAVPVPAQPSFTG